MAGDGYLCSRCAGPADGSGEPCLTCSHEPPPQEATVVWGEYSGVLRTAVLALKHGGRDELAAPLAARMAARLCLEPWIEGVDQVTFVPSHPYYTLRRGLPAAQLLAGNIAHALDLPVRRLLRRRGLRRQAGRSRAERLRLPPSSFRVRTPRPLTGSILLVDDVSTTGTTLRRAATVLLAAGAGAVYVALLATVPDTRRTP